jgi:hypothetical protein
MTDELRTTDATTDTPDATPVAPQTLESMRRDLDALMPSDDLPGSWSTREREAYETRRRVLQARIGQSQNARQTLAEVDAELKPLVEWHDLLNCWRADLCTQLLACERLDPRAHAIKLSVLQIDRGLSFASAALPATLPLDTLMHRDGVGVGVTLSQSCGSYWRGSLPQVLARLKSLQQRRAEAQSQLDDALLSDDERARATAARVEAAKSRPVKLPGRVSV